MLNISARELIDAVGGKLISGDLSKYGSAMIKRASYDSRDVDGSTFFVPIIGEKVDPHRFIAKMLSDSECVVSLTQRENLDYDGDKLLILVEDSVNAVQKLAKLCRSRVNVPVIGITGSVGKTTTRQFITLALGAEKKVYATPGNRNSQIGTPLTLFDFDEDAEIAVLEMGMSMPGEMSRLAEMVRPDTVVFTNIGVTHIENLGSREAILAEKKHILDYAKPGTDVFLNVDNDLLSAAEFDESFVKHYYGVKNVTLYLRDGVTKMAYAKDVDLSEGYPEFTACVNGREVRVKLNVYGLHQVYNALVGLAVADLYGVDLEKAAENMKSYTGFAHRNQILRHDGITIIDDTYNAAPDSMKAALDMLCNLKCEGRRIAVLADMKELGDIAVNAHEKIGAYARDKKNIDAVITYGELAEFISAEFYDDAAARLHCTDEKSLEEKLLENLRPGDVVLFKGSNSMRLFDFVDKVMGHEFM